jgi:hypothetical protein
MPFGFFGTAAFLLLLAGGLPVAYAFVWPAGVLRLGAFLSLAIPAGLVAGAFAFYWVLLPLQKVGISGAAADASNGPGSLEDLLIGRFSIAIVVLLALELLLCKALQTFLSK